MNKRRCLVPDCEYKEVLQKDGSIYLCKGYCANHHYRLKMYGDPTANLTGDPRPAIVVDDFDFALIPIGLNAKDGYAIVDKENSWLGLYKWSLSTGYAATKQTGKMINFLHHILVGKPTVGYVVDHINRNRLDNRLANLRLVTRQFNNINTASRKGSTSMYKGVSFIKSESKWRAVIKLNDTVYRIGSFSDEREAAIAYDGYARLLHGEFAVLNLPHEKMTLAWFTKERIKRFYHQGFTDEEIAIMYEIDLPEIKRITYGVQRQERI